MLRVEKLKIGHQNPINSGVIDAAFELGNLVVLLGRNGCGKTTFLRTLGRFLKPLEGEVSIEEKPLVQYSAKELAAKLSIVTTERIQTPYLSVYDLIALGRYPYLGFLGKLREEDHLAIQTIVEDLDIAHLTQKYITDCSDGEQQMVLLARALAQDTPIILLDEATAHLDFVNRVKIFQTLRTIVEKRQKLIFLATHELEIALKYAHQVALFQNGTVEIDKPTHFVESGKLQAVFAVEDLDYKLKL